MCKWPGARFQCRKGASEVAGSYIIVLPWKWNHNELGKGKIMMWKSDCTTTRPNDEALFVCWDEGGHDSVLAAFANTAVSVSIATSSIPA